MKQFWQALDEPAAARAGAAIRTVWLDRRVDGLLDRSSAQVGAPTAWAAGYDGTGTRVAVLDSGADAEHPDLAGQIAESADFTGDGPGDRNGHGTHTASTVAGTGAASGGDRSGIAPGAELLIGKVLDDGGSGFASWIIDGMEWAVEQDADVVSMSLGAPNLVDCGDPLAQAAQRLAADTLFVVAAGNSGPSRETVASPACAPEVLTVGAVDRDDTTADFSSRGPVPGAVKPEIAAPGVGITAALTGGRGEDAYVAISGTSMAAPHVAGAGAILAQRHPDWSARQLKAALVSAADPDVPGAVAEVGAGRLDVADAVQATVTGPGAVYAGELDWPHVPGDTTAVDVEYRNDSDQPAALSLTVTDVRGRDGRPAPDGMATVTQPTMTVPAHGTATAQLVLDASEPMPSAAYGQFSGLVRATTATGSTVTTPVAFDVEPESVSLTVEVVGRDGGVPNTAGLDLFNIDTGESQRGFLVDEDTTTFRVRSGPHLVSALVSAFDPGASYTSALAQSVTHLAYPQLDLREDTTIVLDAREAQPIAVTGRQPLQDQGSYLGYGRWTEDWVAAAGVIDPGTIDEYYAWSSGRATVGGYELTTAWRLGAPWLTMRVAGPGGFDVDTLYSNGVFATDPLSRFDGHGTAQLVDAGAGTPEELAAADVRGKVALVETEFTWMARQIAEDADSAGAVGVLLHRPSAGRWHSGASNVIPIVTIDAATAAGLISRLGQGPVQLVWSGTPYTPYQYNVVFTESDPVEAPLRYELDEQELARVDATWHSVGSAVQTVDSLRHIRSWNPTDPIPVGLSLRVGVPRTRVEYYTPGDGLWQHTTRTTPLGGFLMNTMNTYPSAGRSEEHWFQGVLRPVAGRALEDGSLELAGLRRGNVLAFDFTGGLLGDSEDGHWSPGNVFSGGSLSLQHDGADLGTIGGLAGGFSVPPEAGDYSLRMVTQQYDEPEPTWQRSTRTETVFSFTSQHADPLFGEPVPLLFPGYGVDLDANNTMPAQPRLPIVLTVTGHAGYEPGRIRAARLDYSYDGGQTWRRAPVTAGGGQWTAVVDHRHAQGESVTLRTTLTDTEGASVTQTVVDAYAVR